MVTDTIAAIATAMGQSGIGIIRITGDEAFSITSRFFRNYKGDKVDVGSYPSHSVHYGSVYEGDTQIDEVLLIVMRAPKSYTRQDTVEIDCHGGIRAMKKILETALKSGARIADPGEFTKRAFLNGRIDLAQAEAVADIIRASNDYALETSVKQLKGDVSDHIKKIRSDILYQIARIESALDDPEHWSLDGFQEEFSRFLHDTIEAVRKLSASAEDGRMLKEGIKTVILGKPNAGKSSLLNVLLGEERAIVTDIAGTTRDMLQEHMYLGGLSLNLIDTAGIRETENTIERIGVAKALQAAESADLILFVTDASKQLDKNDLDILSFIQGRKAIVLLNKSDLDCVVTEEDRLKFSGHPVISVSAKMKSGIDALENAIRDLFFEGKLTFNDQIYITNARHKEALDNSLISLKMVEMSVLNGMPEDFYTIDLTEAYAQLGKIIGESVGDDVVNEIFSRFCMGK